MPSITVRPVTPSVKCCYRILLTRAFREVGGRGGTGTAPTPSRPCSPGPAGVVTTQAASAFASVPPPLPSHALGRKAPHVSEPPATSPVPGKLYGMVQHVRVTVVGTQDLDQRREGVPPYVT
jgi:hypothetical protein